MSEETKDTITIYCGVESYGFFDHFKDEWNPAMFKNGREIDKDTWERYKKLREEFDELHSQIWELFG